MPDGSYECGVIIEQLAHIKSTIDRNYADTVNYQSQMCKLVDKIESRIDEHQRVVDEMFDSMDKRVDILMSDRDKAKGAMHALSLIGGLVVSSFTFVGWLALNGVPQWIKDLLR